MLKCPENQSRIRDDEVSGGDDCDEPAPIYHRGPLVRVPGVWDFLYIEYDLKNHLATFHPVPGAFGILSVHFSPEEWRLSDADRGIARHCRRRFDDPVFKEKRLSHVLVWNNQKPRFLQGKRGFWLGRKFFKVGGQGPAGRRGLGTRGEPGVQFRLRCGERVGSTILLPGYELGLPGQRGAPSTPVGE